MSNEKWYQRLDGALVYKSGRFKVLEIYKKEKEKYNLEYTFYKCLVFQKGEVVAAEGLFGSSLRKSTDAVRWGITKATKLGIINGHIYKQFKDI